MKRRVSLLVLLIASSAGAAPLDARTPLCLKAPQQVFVRSEMRQLLAALQQITGALSTGDGLAVAKSARAVGTAMVGSSEADRELMKALPEGFRGLGLSVHRDFDRIGDMAEGKADAGAILGQLGKTLGTCVGCHATYRADGAGADCK